MASQSAPLAYSENPNHGGTAPRVAYLTAGAAGMFCGSCLRDNTLVAELCRQGVDATLIPTYTPIRTDEQDVSADQVFFGGINVYLQQSIPLFRYVPRLFDRWLDHPWLIRRLAGNRVTPGPQVLGELTLSMLRGTDGNQRKEVDRLCAWLETHTRPNLINFSNILIAGCMPTLRKRLNVPMVVTLQGDDVFLDSLPAHYRTQAIDLIRELATHAEAFVVFNRFYAEYMQEYFGIPAEKLHVLPLGINLRDYARIPERTVRPADRPATVGYLARLAPEKGFHNLVDAFLLMHEQKSVPDVRLLVAGWLGKDHQAYAQKQLARLDAAGLRDHYEFLGEVDRQGKLGFLQRIDVMSVPTQFQDPKGIYVLESLAASVPVVLPHRGAFPELIESTAGGMVCRPDDPEHLAEHLSQLLVDPQLAHEIGARGRAAVHEKHSDTVMAQETLRLYKSLLE